MSLSETVKPVSENVQDQDKTSKRKLVVVKRQENLNTHANILLSMSESKMQYTQTNNRITLVFDCNGTLTSLSEVRIKSGFRLRPFAEYLYYLKKSEKFSLCVWTCAQKQYLEEMQRAIEDKSQISFDRALDR